MAEEKEEEEERNELLEDKPGVTLMVGDAEEEVIQEAEEKEDKEDEDCDMLGTLPDDDLPDDD